MTLLVARQIGPRSIRLVVWLDEARRLEDGTPDPRWVRTYEWSAMTPAETLAQLKARALRETRLLAAEEVAPAGGVNVALPEEGGAL